MDFDRKLDWVIITLLLIAVSASFSALGYAIADSFYADQPVPHSH
ncbi:hypothetical protein [Erythrobacter aureus]|nr:hypothetical protein [Erythrobacter aureus]